MKKDLITSKWAKKFEKQFENTEKISIFQKNKENEKIAFFHELK